MEPNIIPGPTATSGPTIPSVGIDNAFGGLNVPELAGLFSLGGVLAFLDTLWSVYTILAYIVSIILLVLYVYASVKKNLYVDLQTQALRDAERLWDEQYRGVAKSSRLQDIFTHIESDNPNDWKLAIIEADIVMDDTLKQKGYPGATLGERLKSAASNMNTLQDAWEAHKIRNRIAHDGADFVLTKKIAQETIGRYQRVFNELGVS
ncbi:hypothetical protein KC902_03815 [Candidatus Kaiserbacteria bacterium]|nr:hypothetical protein [Candidatus Kaiserbacteria bacterium]USN88426.1 MAG: hypothetical protein H6780_02920 [Candidatus Nomurabacteria bacterium]